jgi:hypothetical protein
VVTRLRDESRLAVLEAPVDAVTGALLMAGAVGG